MGRRIASESKQTVRGGPKPAKVGLHQPRSQALPSCLRKDPGWGWSRVTRISRGKLKLSLGYGGRGARLVNDNLCSCVYYSFG